MAAAARSRGGRRHGAIVGVDVGGTTTAVGLVTPDGDVIADASAPTRAGERDPLETIVGLMAEVTERAGRAARAIAAVGGGVGLPVFVDNDVNALALGEATLGAARGARSLVVLSTGTGIGAGIVLEG